MKKLSCIVALLLLGIIVHGVVTHMLGDDELFAMTAQRFGFGAWRGQSRASYARPVVTCDIPQLTMATNGLPVQAYLRSGQGRRKLVIRPLLRGIPLLELQTQECDDLESAQCSIISHFSLMTTTCDYSSCTNDFGDRSYTFGNSAVFSRNNIFVFVDSYTNAISAEAVARQIDADILRRSTEAAR